MNRIKLFFAFLYTSVVALFITAIIMIAGCASEPVSAPTELTECEMLGYAAVATEVWNGTESTLPARCK